MSHFHRKGYIYIIHFSLEKCTQKLGLGWARVLAEQEPLLGGQALPVDLVLLQLLVIWVPEFHDDPLNVKGIHSMGRNDFPVYLG